MILVIAGLFIYQGLNSLHHAAVIGMGGRGNPAHAASEELASAAAESGCVAGELCSMLPSPWQENTNIRMLNHEL